MKQVILGTAGHIDHGKTTLVRALTGIDTDRLKEEKERGITIELGFAHLQLPGGQILGIVAPGDGSTPSETLLELRGVPYRDSVPPGTPVLSSGLGGVFPNGIPVGTVIGLAQEDTGWERSYLVRPAANPGSATHVLILTGTHDSTVASAFAPDSEP